MCVKVNMLKIQPEDEIVFSKIENGMVGGEIEISNSSTNTIAFKIKTTAPDKFRVRPSHGILIPGAKKSINVVLQSDQQTNIALTKDKFLVMCMELEAALADATEAEIAEIWKKTANTVPSIEQHRLMCTFNPNGILKQRSKRDISNGGFSEHDHLAPTSSYLFSQLIDRTNRLEKQVKLNRGLQLANLFFVLLLIVGVIYIINILLQNNGGYCIKR